MKTLQAALLRNKPDDTGSSNPDPTMQHPPGTPKGENMPPRGGEDIAPAEDTRSPKETQEQVKRSDGRVSD